MNKFITLTHHVSPAGLLTGQEGALMQDFRLDRLLRCLIGLPWAESTVTHTAAAATATNHLPLSVCVEHLGSACMSSSVMIQLVCERARTHHLFVSSLQPSPAVWMSQCYCCPLAVGGGAAPQGEELELSPKPRKVSALTRERLHLKMESSCINKCFKPQYLMCTY